MILQFSTLSVRVIALTWLLAVVDSYKFVIFILIFVPRMFILAYLDPKSQRRSTFRNTLWCSCYCLISAIWDKDERYPVSSRRAFLCMNTLDTVESFVFISYAGFISTVCSKLHYLYLTHLCFAEFSDEVLPWCSYCRRRHFFQIAFLGPYLVVAATCTFFGAIRYGQIKNVFSEVVVVFLWQ